VATWTCSWSGCRKRISRGRYCRKHSKAYAEYRRRQAVKAGEKISREQVFKRDKGICGICGKKISGPWHVDHVIPIARGGRHVNENVQASHPLCNQKKGSKIFFFLKDAA
jgi:5-methylcytosine-specific restriction endonuclease McrA